MTTIAALGLGSFLYGFYIMWRPLAFIIGGVVFVVIALTMNQLYDPSKNKRR
ncbi:hypothetical protein FC24_GL000415 [Loigolactobacillus rennini DSM 20253]|uniref:Uncharacterized protein n=2 Tax=Loigolactobacillus rennini TaxID=238013 RepID=A0A0R2D1R1_9LACO|nr:hypothetical protein FC24_GL000415 [Loigolactobacillus rennini DSM 20253]